MFWADAFAWINSDSGLALPADYYCPTRDVADGRLSKIVREAQAAGFSQQHAPLIAALTGELTANCFDHNLGAWRDIAGCWLSWTGADLALLIVVADRGQGIRSSLRRADPGLQTDRQALATALTKHLSGRQPERRGRGLKFIVASLKSQLAGSTFQLMSGSARFKATFPLETEVVNHITEGHPPLLGTLASLELRAPAT